MPATGAYTINDHPYLTSSLQLLLASHWRQNKIRHNLWTSPSHEPRTGYSYLRAHEPELKQTGIVRLALFGSIARGDARSHSDIDLLAAFDESRRLSLLDVIQIENQLAALLGQPVDLIEKGTLKLRVKERFDREAVRAF